MPIIPPPTASANRASKHRIANGLLNELFDQLIKCIPGDLKESFHDRRNDIREILCYLVAVDAAMLDAQIRQDVSETAGCGDTLGPLYVTEPEPQTCAAFEQYVMGKWPVLTFALDPVTDQQNIADALSLRRDMQMAVAYAFATGRINFNNGTKYRRMLEQDSEAIALNRTVTAFAHGNESFGWRFSPRYQNQPPEATTFSAFVNRLISTGPGRNYRIKNSKLEAGQREFTAVIVMPSFLQHIRFELCGNWFNLVHPDNMTILTARMIWLGQRLMLLRQAASQVCNSGEYRSGDVQPVLRHNAKTTIKPIRRRNGRWLGILAEGMGKTSPIIAPDGWRRWEIALLQATPRVEECFVLKRFLIGLRRKVAEEATENHFGRQRLDKYRKVRHRRPIQPLSFPARLNQAERF